MSAFIDLLSRWKTRNISQHSDAEPAMLLLQEAGSAFSAEKADLGDRESWIDFLDTTKKTDFLKSWKMILQGYSGQRLSSKYYNIQDTISRI